MRGRRRREDWLGVVVERVFALVQKLLSELVCLLLSFFQVVIDVIEKIKTEPDKIEKKDKEVKKKAGYILLSHYRLPTAAEEESPVRESSRSRPPNRGTLLLRRHITQQMTG